MSTKKEYVPPTFVNLGKPLKDLLKKSFDIVNNPLAVKTVHKTNFGLSLNTTGKTAQDRIEGEVDATYKDKTIGEVNGVLNTASGKAVGKVKRSNVYGFEVAVSGGFDPTSKKPLVKGGNFYTQVDLEKRQDFISTTLSGVVGERPGAKDSGIHADLEASFVLGSDGFSVGSNVEFPASERAVDALKGNIAFEYAASDFTASLRTENNMDTVNVGWFHRLSRQALFGAEFTYVDPENKSKLPASKTLTVASQYELDVDTTIKVKADTTGAFTTAIEHRLQNPRVLIGLASSFKASGSSLPTKADKFGFSVTLGDF